MNTRPPIASTLEIRSAHEADTDRILAFYREHFLDAPLLADREYFAWRFRCDRSAPSPGDSVVACQGETVVGFLGLANDRLWDGTGWHDASWCFNLMIDPNHRGGLTVLRMFQQAMRGDRVLLATGAGPHMLKLYQSLGWLRLSVVDTFYLVRRPSGLIRWANARREGSKLRRMLEIMAKAADVPISRFVDWRTKRLAKSGLNADSIHEFESIRPLVRESERSQEITSCRDPNRLYWKTFERPVGKSVAWKVIDASGKRVLGYLIAKLMKQPGVASWIEIVDQLTVPNDATALDALFSVVSRQAAERNVDFVRARCSLEEHKQWFRSHGWIRKTMPVSDDVFCYSSNPDLLERIRRGPWHFTSLVSDRADYGRDEWPGEV